MKSKRQESEEQRESIRFSAVLQRIAQRPNRYDRDHVRARLRDQGLRGPLLEQAVKSADRVAEVAGRGPEMKTQALEQARDAAGRLGGKVAAERAAERAEDAAKDLSQEDADALVTGLLDRQVERRLAAQGVDRKFLQQQEREKQERSLRHGGAA
jgi:hypothetical protein